MANHASRAHSRFAASAAERWFACPGSIRLCEGVPERQSTYAEEGTRAHELLELYLMGIRQCEEDTDKEMMDAINVAIDYINTLSDGLEEAKFEQQLLLSEDVGGTADVVGYFPSTHTLRILDYKHGSGIAVEARNNKQLRIYALGALHNYKWQIDTAILTIIQPRAHHVDGPIRQDVVSILDLIDFETEVEEAVARCLEPDAPLIPGEVQCCFCPAASFCPAREAQALATIGNQFGHVKQITKEALPDPKQLTPDRLGQILAAKDLIEDWLQSVQEEAYKSALAGVKIPGRKLVNPVGKRKWAFEVEPTAIDLAVLTMTSPDEWTETKLIGIVEAEKKLKPYGKPALEQFAFLTTKQSSGKLQLVSEEDNRPAVDPASQAFKDVVQLPHIKIGDE